MIVDFAELPNVRETHGQEKLVFRGGCWDLLHEGHVRALNYSKMHGDVLVIGVSSDERVKQRKGEARPIISELSRLAIVDAIKPVNYSFIMPMPRPELSSPTLQVIDALRPDVFVEHDENIDRWSEDDLGILRLLGVRVVLDHRPYDISTSSIIEKITGSQARVE